MKTPDIARRWIGREGLGLLTDFYELTMLSGYLKHGLAEQQVAFEYFFRTLPAHNGFVLTAGLEQLLDYLEHLRFTPEDLAYLESLKVFDQPTLDYLSAFRPDINVWAIPEGTPVFPHEPIIRLTGPLPHLQLVETFLLNSLNYQSLIATKTARICAAAQGDPVLEFGLRRAQGPDGGLIGSRGAFIGGAVATSNVLAGRLFNLPVKGTHAHSWVMSFSTEKAAFEAFVESFPQGCVLLVDTYDTLKSGVPNAIAVFKERPHLAPAIRIDSGDLARLSKAAHRLFAQAGMPNVRIVGTNDLDEDLIADLKRQGAKINTWAVGTHLITSKDHPALDGVYKLVAIEKDGVWSPRIKLSANPEKATDPGLKRPIRCFDQDHHPLGDILLTEQEPLPADVVAAIDRLFLHQKRKLSGIAQAEELLVPVYQAGRRVSPRPSLPQIRQHAQTSLAAFPEEYLRLRNPEIYWLGLSLELAKLKNTVLRDLNE
ncbi:nicotinate phosphoribosyltransferase [candidate division FCPU426 bacterium]|nr:nicotinate phosphoribosyltransferase [candidate division FCPU426 bacterium]